jgi:hypothetical protein
MASMLTLPFVRRPKPKPTLSPVQTCSSSSAPRLRGACASRCAALRAVEGRSGGGQTWPGGIGVEAEVWRADIHDDVAVFALSRFVYPSWAGGDVGVGVSVGVGNGNGSSEGEWPARLDWLLRVMWTRRW